MTILPFLGLLLFLNLLLNSVLLQSYRELLLDHLLCQLSHNVSDHFLKFENLFLLDEVFQLLDAFTGQRQLRLLRGCLGFLLRL